MRLLEGSHFTFSIKITKELDFTILQLSVCFVTIREVIMQKKEKKKLFCVEHNTEEGREEGMTREGGIE